MQMLLSGDGALRIITARLHAVSVKALFLPNGSGSEILASVRLESAFSPPSFALFVEKATPHLQRILQSLICRYLDPEAGRQGHNWRS